MKIPALRCTAACLVLVLTTFGSAAGQSIELGQIDDFQLGQTADWGANNVTVTNIADAGPLGAGDFALEAEFPQRFVFFNEMQWTGDYTTAGVVKISMDVRHLNEFNLDLRLGIANGLFGATGSGDTYVTDYSILVPNDGQWHHLTFDVTADDFIASGGNTLPVPDAAAALTNVTHLRILHNPAAGSFLGESISGSMLVDNIMAEGADLPVDADFDGDDDVDGEDFLIWQRGVGAGSTQPAGDADGSGVVDGLDLDVWEGQFGPAPATPAVAAIPEPGAAAMAVLAGTFALLPGRRRR